MARNRSRAQVVRSGGGVPVDRRSSRATLKSRDLSGRAKRQIGRRWLGLTTHSATARLLYGRHIRVPARYAHGFGAHALLAPALSRHRDWRAGGAARQPRGAWPVLEGSDQAQPAKAEVARSPPADRFAPLRGARPLARLPVRQS